MKNEYDYIERIGNTYESYNDSATRKINYFFHKQQVKTVVDLLKKMKLQEFERVIDLGCSDGGWLEDYKLMSFRNIIGIDISKERTEKAKSRGYSEVFDTNAYDLPFENNSESCVISNGMFVHVLQDSDKLKIFTEVKRVLKKNGIFIFNFANARAKGTDKDTTLIYSRTNTIQTINSLVKKAGLSVERVSPGYYIYPKIGAHKKIVSISTAIVFPITNSLLKKSNNLKLSEVIYLGIRKTE